MESEEKNAQEDGELRKSTTAFNSAAGFSYFQVQARRGATEHGVEKFQADKWR